MAGLGTENAIEDAVAHLAGKDLQLLFLSLVHISDNLLK